MQSKRSTRSALSIGILGILLVLVGLDMLYTNYLGTLVASGSRLVRQTDQEIEPDAIPVDTRSPETATPSRPTNTPPPTQRPSTTPRPSATPKPSRTATKTPTSTLSPTPTEVTAWRACPGTYLSHLNIGDKAYVSYEPPLANRVRRNPNTSAQVLGKIEPGEEVEILNGPSCSNGWVWWKVSSLEKNLIGWTSEGDGTDYWLIKIEN